MDKDNDKQLDLASIVSKPYEMWTEEERKALIDEHLKELGNQESERQMWRTLLKKPKGEMSLAEKDAFDIFVSLLKGPRGSLRFKERG